MKDQLQKVTSDENLTIKAASSYLKIEPLKLKLCNFSLLSKDTKLNTFKQKIV